MTPLLARPIAPLLSFVTFATLLAHPLAGQETAGGIAGQVASDDGAPVSGARIVVTGEPLIRPRAAVTDDGGGFLLLDLPPGPYAVEVSRLGLRTVRIEGVEVRLGQVSYIEDGTLSMEIAAVDLAPLVVESRGRFLDYRSATTETSVRYRTFSTLPVARDYRELAVLVPQSTESGRGDPVNIAGATGLENASYVDGFNTTDPFLGAVGTKLPYDFVREYNVKTAGYGPEYGGATGGIFDAVTRTGSNDWRISAFGYLNTAGVTADAERGVAEFVSEGADRYDVGIAVGGPLLRDRLWFFGAYDPTFERARVEIPGHGFFDEDLTEHLFAGKLSWRAGEDTDVTISTFGDPSTHDRVGGSPFSSLQATILDPDVFLNRVERGGVNVVGSLRHRLGDDAVLELIAGSQWTSFFDGPQAGDDEARLDCVGVGGECDPGVPASSLDGGFGEQFAFEGQRYSVRTASSFSLGSHHLQIGAEYEEYRLQPFAASNSEPGVIVDFGPNFADRDLDGRYLLIVQERVADLGGRAPIAYVRDAWDVGKGVHLTYGLRWEGLYVLDSRGDVAQRFTDQWQPRMALIWSPGGTAGQKFTATAGRYYHRMPLRVAAGYYAGSEGSTNWSAYFEGDPRAGGTEIPDTRDTFCCSIQPERDLRGTHADEVTLGWERLYENGLQVGVRGIHRNLREVVNVGVNPDVMGDTLEFPGNPGRGDLANLDRPQRNYWALELTGDWTSGDDRTELHGSYVLSRNYGNFPGIYNSDGGQPLPNANGIFALEESMPLNKGPLPNDRPHQLKVWGSHRLAGGFTTGALITVASGTPLSRRETFFRTQSRFVTQRGSEGRLPTLWDLNLRLAYPVRFGPSGEREARLLLDAFHIGNPQTETWTFDTASLDLDANGPGEPIPLPTFGLPQGFQPPFMLRLGVEVRM
jgi:hypothetical protein